MVVSNVQKQETLFQMCSFNIFCVVSLIIGRIVICTGVRETNSKTTETLRCKYDKICIKICTDSDVFAYFDLCLKHIIDDRKNMYFWHVHIFLLFFLLVGYRLCFTGSQIFTFTWIGHFRTKAFINIIYLYLHLAICPIFTREWLNKYQQRKEKFNFRIEKISKKNKYKSET